jgi:hypothetical protein
MECEMNLNSKKNLNAYTNLILNWNYNDNSTMTLDSDSTEVLLIDCDVNPIQKKNTHLLPPRRCDVMANLDYSYREPHNKRVFVTFSDPVQLLEFETLLFLNSEMNNLNLNKFINIINSTEKVNVINSDTDSF